MPAVGFAFSVFHWGAMLASLVCLDIGAIGVYVGRCRLDQAGHAGGACQTRRWPAVGIIRFAAIGMVDRRELQPELGGAGRLTGGISAHASHRRHGWDQCCWGQGAWRGSCQKEAFQLHC